jgi:hypothetical protein
VVVAVVAPPALIERGQAVEVGASASDMGVHPG